MARFVFRRFLSMMLVLFAVSIVTFLIFNVIPNGDPAERMAGQDPHGDQHRRDPRGVGLQRQRPRAVRDDDEEGLHAAISSPTSPSSTWGRRSRKGLPATLSLAIGAGDHVARCIDRARPLQRHARRQDGRPLPDRPRPRRRVAARVLGRGADELLPRLQARDIPQRRLCAAHGEPVRTGSSTWSCHGRPCRCCSSASTRACCAPTCSTRSTRTTCAQRARRGCRSAA